MQNASSSGAELEERGEMSVDGGRDEKMTSAQRAIDRTKQAEREVKLQQ